MKKHLIAMSELSGKRDDFDHHELVQLAVCYLLPPILREHQLEGEQLPRHFPVERQLMKERQNVNEPLKVDRTIGLKGKYWKPMTGGYTPEKRIQELETAKALIEEEIKRLEKEAKNA